VFAENPHRLLTKEELIEKVWNGEFVEEGNVARHVSMLRKALSDDGEDRKYIVTVQGHGYRFVRDVKAAERIGEPSAEPALSRGQVEETTISPSPSFSKRDFGLSLS
jgi:DNA-binding winged helix-turn-helix (wHTH) protein